MSPSDSRLPLTPPARLAVAGDLEALTNTAMHAFRDDPLHRWIFSEEETWLRKSPRFWRALLRARLGRRVVLTTDRGEALAIWWAPGAHAVGRSADLALGLRIGGILGWDALRVGRALAPVASHKPSAPHWYLELLATDPAHQGRGLATALLAPVLAHCDAVGHRSYLESSRPENVPFYERHGFAVTGTFEIADGPRLPLMGREAR